MSDKILDYSKAELVALHKLNEHPGVNHEIFAYELRDELERQAQAAVAQLREERDEARATNESVAVCATHVREVVGEGCLVCDLSAAEAERDEAVRLLDELFEGANPTQRARIRALSKEMKP